MVLSIVMITMRAIFREAGIELLFICGSSSRPLEQIFSMSIMSLWVEPRELLDC